MAVRMQHELVERAGRGDHEAFTRLAADQVDRLYAVAKLIVRDPDLAYDAVQEAMIRCWRQLPKLRDPHRFDGWLYRILVRAASDQLAGTRRFRASIAVVRDEDRVEDDAARLADREQLEQGFDRLSVDHRAIVVLHHYLGLDMPEIASALGIPEGTAKSRYHYAIGAMRAALDAGMRDARRERVPQ
jgi:RNA polymerase sigma-70 factor (ECF subfamily)